MQSAKVTSLVRFVNLNFTFYHHLVTKALNIFQKKHYYNYDYFFLIITFFGVFKMKKEVFYGKGMGKLKEEDLDLYQAIVALNDAVWNGKALDYKTQKLIAIGIAASNADSRATEKQIMSAKKELGVTRDEVVDVLKVVLLTSGMQPFNKALQIANKVFEE